MEKHERILTAIVLQGGGALGAYECGALKALYETRPHFKPAVVTGISVGALNAVLLVGGSVETLEKTWRERLAIPAIDPLAPFSLPAYRPFLPQLVQANLSLWQQNLSLLENLNNPGMYRTRPEYFVAGPLASLFTTSFCETVPLQQTLEATVDFDQLNTSKTRVVLTAVNATTGQTVTFGNLASLADYAKAQKPAPFANNGRLTADHILAAGAFVPGFPPQWVDGICGIDAGFSHTTPLAEAITALEHYVPDPDEVVVGREVIVVELIPPGGAAPTNAYEAWERANHILYANKMALDRKLFARKNSYLDLAIDVKGLGQKIDDLAALAQQGDPGGPLTAGILALRDDMTHIRENDHAYAELTTEHELIDYFAMVHFIAPPALTNSGDFSEAAIAGRIAAGYQAAKDEKLDDLTLHHVEHTFRASNKAYVVHAL